MQNDTEQMPRQINSAGIITAVCRIEHSPQILQESWQQWNTPNSFIKQNRALGKSRMKPKVQLFIVIKLLKQWTTFHIAKWFSLHPRCSFEKLPLVKFSPGQVLASGNFSSTLCPLQDMEGICSQVFVCWFIQCTFNRYRNLSKQRRKGQEFKEPMLMKSHLSFAIHKDNF